MGDPRYTIDAELMRTISAANLVRATSADDFEGVRTLLERGVGPNRLDASGDTALHRAARKGRLAIAQLLLQHGADVNLKNGKGQTPLHLALSERNMSAVKFLLENGADPDLRDQIDRASSFELACTFDDAEFARVLLAFGADIIGNENPRDHLDGSDGTPLHIACRRARLDTIKMLVGKGADVNNLFCDIFSPQDLAWCLQALYADDCVDDCVEYLLHNVAKLHIAGMYVCRRNVECMDPVGIREVSGFGLNCHGMKTDIRPECAKEIAAMKVDIVGHRSSGDAIYMYDVLVSSVDGLVAMFRECPLRESLRSSGYTIKYRLYADILSAKIHNADWRLALHDNYVAFLHGIFPNLPYLCAELIRSYLSDTDLRRLFCARCPKDFYNY